ncbi:MAG TPA: hypothetical protein VKT32_04505 [Chthonomonadaceae bacterium]|nr:hypothetical protein [Chthonomonadaceae bacterium]
MTLRTAIGSSAISGVAVVLCSTLLLAPPAPGRAIPAFARKYHTTCARCHSVVPRLNNYGWNFKLRGFHVPGDEDIGFMPTPEDKHLSLLDQVPLAVRLLGNVSGSTATGSQGASVLDSEIDLLMAGRLDRRTGFWAELDTSKNPDGSYSTGIGNVRGIFTDLIRRQPTALNLEVGKFNMDEFGISTGRILTQNPYAIYAVGDALGNFPESDEVQGLNFYGAVGTGIGKGVAAAATKQGQAGAVSEAEQKALEEELNKEQAAKPPPENPEIVAARAVLDTLVKKGTITQEDADKTLADLASKLPPPATPPPTTPPAEAAAAAAAAPVSLARSDYDIRKGLFYQAGFINRGFDNNSKPQGYARFIYADKHDWWIGPVAYFGTNSIAGSPGFTDNFTRYDLEAAYNTGPRRDVAGVARRAVDIYLAGQYGSDSNAAGSGVRVEHAGGFIEGTYILDDQNLFVARWDRLYAGKAPGIDVSTLTLNYTRYLQRNLKVGLEYVPDLLRNSPTHVHGDQYFLFYDFTF